MRGKLAVALWVVASACGDGGASPLDAAQAEVHDNAIGACVQVPDYDTGRLTTDVAYHGNGTTLDAIDLPIPDADSPL